MDQQFESDVEHDLMTDSPTVSADEAFEEESYDDSFEGDDFEEEGMEEDAMMDEMDDMDQYDEDAEMYGDEAYFGEEEFEEGFEEEFEDEFAEEEMDVMVAMEEAVANALDAEDSDEFLRRLIRGIRGVAGAVSRGTGQAGRVAGQVGRVARGVQDVAGGIAGARTQRGRRGGRRRAGATGSGTIGSNSLQHLLPILQQHAAQGVNEMSLFEVMVDWFEQENADEVLPVLAGVAARAALRPLSHPSGAIAGQAVRRQILRGATQAARNLVSRQGPQAVRALRPIATSVGRIAAHRGIKPAALPGAIRQAAARVAAQPALARRLSQPAMRTDRSGVPRSRLSISGGGVPRRFVVNGPVEIIIRR